MGSLVESLSDSQKACLRLVAKNMSSKEIAIETSLSPQTVDTYIKAAMGRLGVSTRREAARILADWDLSQKSGSPSDAVVPAAFPTEDGGAADRGGSADRLFSLPPVGGRSNDLSAAARLTAALKVAMVGATVVIALALLIAGVLKTFH